MIQMEISIKSDVETSACLLYNVIIIYRLIDYTNSQKIDRVYVICFISILYE